MQKTTHSILPRRPKKSKLYILYKPTSQTISPDDKVLSFLMPKDENDFVNSFDGQVFLGRKEMNTIREKARLAYIDIVARISSTPCNGQTLRQALALSGKGNPWWYTKFSFKDVESDSTFNIFLHVFTISSVVDREKIKNIVLCGDPSEIREILSSRYQGIRRGMRCYFKTIYNLIWGILSRIKSCFDSLHAYFALRLFSTLPDIHPDATFQGFWDWSVDLDRQNNLLKDTYFKSLPEKLKQKGIRNAWFLWLSPNYKPGTKKRSLKEILNHIKGHPQLIFLQKFLDLKDIIFAFLDLRPLYRYLIFQRSKSFKRLFIGEEFNFFPLLNRQLFRDFVGSVIPLCMLIECASRRAFAKYKPKTNLTFLEFYLHSRALYHGGKLGNPETVHFTVQHASYNREKTFFVFDRERELYGKPDGYAVPVPDYVFVMGELGREILVESGFPSHRVLLTGSARYEHIRPEHFPKSLQLKKKYTVLIAASLDIDLEIEMIEAVSLVATNFPQLRLVLRNHPFARMENHPLFHCFSDMVEISDDLLDEDLRKADLVIFSYSTIAEEAFIKGIPVWQWAPTKFNGSVFCDLPVIPVFYSVKELKDSFKQFVKSPTDFIPSEATIELVLRKCFYAADGRNSERIVEAVEESISA